MIPFSNIQQEKAISVASADFEDTGGFFFRCDTGGTLKYVPFANDTADVITKTVAASAIFNDPVLMRKIVSSGTTASGIYIGKGL